MAEVMPMAHQWSNAVIAASDLNQFLSLKLYRSHLCIWRRHFAGRIDEGDWLEHLAIEQCILCWDPAIIIRQIGGLDHF